MDRVPQFLRHVAPTLAELKQVGALTNWALVNEWLQGNPSDRMIAVALLAELNKPGGGNQTTRERLHSRLSSRHRREELRQIEACLDDRA